MKIFRATVVLASTIVVIFALTVSVSLAQGRSGDFRRFPYAVFSDDPALMDLFPLRHVFPNAFSADLTLDEVDLMASLGVATERLVLYRPSPPPGACSPWPQCKNNEPPPANRQYFPSDQTPWGIETIYNDPGVAATSGGAGVDVAVLDTGAFKDHLDLVGRIAGCVDFTGGPPGAIRIREGRCDDSAGEFTGHGTHVAGTIAADGGSDGLGIYGVAPGANLLIYRICQSSGCWTDDTAAAIDYAGSHGAEIVSMSLGGDTESILIRDAIARNSHVLFVAAAGNDGPALGSIDYPGANPNVIAVGAIAVDLQVPSWSSRGINDGDYIIEAMEVEFGAPGVSVESTWSDGGYRLLSGTSMATPHISGLVAKLWQGSAGATRSYLQSRAADIWDAGDDPATGLGLPTVP